MFTTGATYVCFVSLKWYTRMLYAYIRSFDVCSEYSKTVIRKLYTSDISVSWTMREWGVPIFKLVAHFLIHIYIFPFGAFSFFWCPLLLLLLLPPCLALLSCILFGDFFRCHHLSTSANWLYIYVCEVSIAEFVVVHLQQMSMHHAQILVSIWICKNKKNFAKMDLCNRAKKLCYRRDAQLANGPGRGRARTCIQNCMNAMPVEV